MWLHDVLIGAGVKSIDTQFWRRVQVSEDLAACWPYRGRLWRYVEVMRGGRRELAHRFALRSTGVVIPAGMVVMHLCDNPGCCNPTHLRAGTYQDNTQDMMSKGRWRGRGELRLSR